MRERFMRERFCIGTARASRNGNETHYRHVFLAERREPSHASRLGTDRRLAALRYHLRIHANVGFTASILHRASVLLP
jgi:hypothetical protein